MHTISVIYRKPGDPQKYITFCQMPGDDFNEYFTKRDVDDVLKEIENDILED